MNWRDELNAARLRTAREIERRQRELAHMTERAEAAGRAVFEKAIKTGEQVLARTPAEVRALGFAALQGRLPQAVAQQLVSSGAKRPTSSQAPSRKAMTAKPSSSGPRSTLQVLGEQAGAAARGAIDEASFGLADKGSAAIQAIAAGGPDGFLEKYAEQLAEEQAADSYDEKHHGLARNAGRVVGFVGSLAATGGGGAAAKAGARFFPTLVKATKAANATKRAVALDGGLTTLAVTGGGVSGVVGQATSDLLTGRRSNLHDYAGAALGGSTGALLLRVRPLGEAKAATALDRVIRDSRTVGGVEGASTSVYQDLLSGRDVGLVNAAEAARGGAMSAAAGDLAGKYGSNALSRKAKGELGEALSMVKAFAAGDGVPLGAPRRNVDVPGVVVHGPGRQVRIDLPNGRYSRADQVTNRGVVTEAKFGPSANLTTNQRHARRLLGPSRYRVDHWLPADVGRAGAVGLGAFGGYLHLDEEG